MKLTTMNTMAFAAALAILTTAAAAQAQTTVHHNTSTVTGAGEGFGAGAQGTPGAKDDLFAGTEIFAKNATDVTEITMDPDTLAMVDGKDKDKAHNTILQVVRTYEYDKPGMYNMADVDKFREKLNTGDWHCSVHTRSLKTGESTDICSKRRTDDLHETAIITVGPKELTFIHTISHHATMIGMPGMGEMGMFPGPLSSLRSMAMLDPDMLQLRMELNDLKSGMRLNMAPMAPVNFSVMPGFDGEAFGKAFGKAFDERDWEKSAKDWEKSGIKAKEFTAPDGTKTIIITPRAPQAPEIPQAPEVPQNLGAPEVPQAAPATPAPPATPAAPAPAPPQMQ